VVGTAAVAAALLPRRRPVTETPAAASATAPALETVAH
jgi:hypothetical protein